MTVSTRLSATLRGLRETIDSFLESDDSRKVTLHLPREVAQRLHMHAAEECRAMSDIVADAVLAYGHREQRRVLRFPRA